MAHRVLVVVNKWWECDPLIGVLLHDKARPRGSDQPASALPWPSILNHPRFRPSYPDKPRDVPSIPPRPRAVFGLENIRAEVWCISDLMEHLPDGEWQSSSEAKAKLLPSVFAGQPPILVIAVGTAGTPTNESLNGSVVVGTGVFVHNGKPEGSNPISNWTGGPFDRLIETSISENAFEFITAVGQFVAPRLLVPPGNPAAKRILIASRDSVAIGNVNVTNYADYLVTDKAALDAFIVAGTGKVAGSLETTHALIRAQSESLFMFVSGITDRVGHFDEEVAPHEYAQNFVAAHNAGVAIAWMLPMIDAQVAKSGLEA